MLVSRLINSYSYYYVSYIEYVVCVITQFVFLSSRFVVDRTGQRSVSLNITRQTKQINKQADINKKNGNMSKKMSRPANDMFIITSIHIRGWTQLHHFSAKYEN